MWDKIEVFIIGILLNSSETGIDYIKFILF
jgi:hypothetical protein